MERVRWLFVTFAGSSISDEKEFEKRLKAKLAEAQVIRCGTFGRGEGQRVASRFYGVRETRRVQDGEVTCFAMHVYSVLVLFDDKVGFEDFDRVKDTFYLRDDSMMMVNWRRGKMLRAGELPSTEEGERKFAESVQELIEQGVSASTVERCVFGTKFDVAEELCLVEKRRVLRRYVLYDAMAQDDG
jgi:hypothetical protein